MERNELKTFLAPPIFQMLPSPRGRNKGIELLHALCCFELLWVYDILSQDLTHRRRNGGAPGHRTSSWMRYLNIDLTSVARKEWVQKSVVPLLALRCSAASGLTSVLSSSRFCRVAAFQSPLLPSWSSEREAFESVWVGVGLSPLTGGLQVRADRFYTTDWHQRHSQGRSDVTDRTSPDANRVLTGGSGGHLGPPKDPKWPVCPENGRSLWFFKTIFDDFFYRWVLPQVTGVARHNFWRFLKFKISKFSSESQNLPKIKPTLMHKNATPLWTQSVKPFLRYRIACAFGLDWIWIFILRLWNTHKTVVIKFQS